MCMCNKFRDDKLHHECGVLGIYGVQDAAGMAYYGLHALQRVCVVSWVPSPFVDPVRIIILPPA